MNNLVSLRIVTAVLVVFCAAPLMAGQDHVDLLRESLEVSPELPYEGFMSYTRHDRHFDWEIFAHVVRRSPTEKQIVMQSPHVLKDIRMLMHDNTMWVTDLDEERQKEVSRAVKPISWVRVFDEVDQFHIDNLELLLENYTINRDDDVMLAGREAICLRITPNKKNRPSAVVWIDPETKRHLKYIRSEADGDLIETFELKDFIPLTEESLPEWNFDGLKEIGRMNENGEKPEPLSFVKYAPEKLPKGFAFLEQNQWESPRGTIVHTEFTDGLARVSLFQRLLTDREREEFAQEENDPNAIKRYHRHDREIYTRTFDDFRFSLIGDLEPDDMAHILTCLKPSR